MKKLVTVEFRYEGLTFDNDIVSGVLIDGGKVFVCGDDGVPGLYNSIQTDKPDVYLVDLDSDGKDYINPKLLLDLVSA